MNVIAPVFDHRAPQWRGVDYARFVGEYQEVIAGAMKAEIEAKKRRLRSLEPPKTRNASKRPHSLRTQTLNVIKLNPRASPDDVAATLGVDLKAVRIAVNGLMRNKALRRVTENNEQPARYVAL